MNILSVFQDLMLFHSEASILKRKKGHNHRNMGDLVSYIHRNMGNVYMLHYGCTLKTEDQDAHLKKLFIL